MFGTLMLKFSPKLKHNYNYTSFQFPVEMHKWKTQKKINTYIYQLLIIAYILFMFIIIVYVLYSTCVYMYLLESSFHVVIRSTKQICGS